MRAGAQRVHALRAGSAGRSTEAREARSYKNARVVGGRACHLFPRRACDKSERMQPRHAAALALVGWYLMVPTPFNDNSLRYDPTLPLSKWKIVGSFDSADDCAKIQAYQEKQSNHVLKTIKDIDKLKDPNEPTAEQRDAFLLGMSECVSTDDPRLKEK